MLSDIETCMLIGTNSCEISDTCSWVLNDTKPCMLNDTNSWVLSDTEPRLLNYKIAYEVRWLEIGVYRFIYIGRFMKARLSCIDYFLYLSGLWELDRFFVFFSIIIV